MTTVDESALRATGVYGVRRHEAPTNLAATTPATIEIPEEFDSSLGLDITSMFGNNDYGDCFWAMVANALIFQALVDLNDREQPEFVEGFTPPTNEEPVGWYATYLKAQGTPLEGPPGAGTGIYSGAQSILDQGLALYVGVLGPTVPGGEDGSYTYDPQVIRQAIYEFDGGAGFCLALDPKAMQEFARHVPWGTESTKPDAEMGHAVDGSAYAAAGLTFWTWAHPQMSTDAFDTNCIDGLVLMITEGYVTKNGEDAALALAARWGLTAAP